ncbi:putative DNA repair protein [Cercophora samala]|uniref:DNA repair protein n=1 Tax=Cercophora samala TaxID=330535 RepID=A0AA39ZJD0_9PEZI|nr:putative DNA repair protein [Cercophora samala]
MTLPHTEGDDGSPEPEGPLPAAPPTPLVPLGNNIFLFEPSVPSASAAHDKISGSSSGCPPPSLIILCTWLGGATTPRVAKYVEGYRKAFPDATIVLVRTVFADISARSFAAVRSRLRPARDAIIKALQPPPPTTTRIRTTESGTTTNPVIPQALLHMFSHGGCNTAIQLALSISEVAGTLLCDHLRQIVFDCCPGDTSFAKAFNAATLSLPATSSAPIRALATAAVFAAVATITALQKAGFMSSVNDMRRELNKPTLFGTAARRLYLFSRADRMVGPADVQSHAQLAREAGCEVGLVLFREAPHCALVTEDATKYWRAIQGCWMGESLPQLNGESKLLSCVSSVRTPTLPAPVLPKRHGLPNPSIRLPSSHRDSRSRVLHLPAGTTTARLLRGCEADFAPVRRASPLNKPRLSSRHLPPPATLLRHGRHETSRCGSRHLSRLAHPSCSRASTIQGTRRQRRTRRRVGRAGCAFGLALAVSCRFPRRGSLWRRQGGLKDGPVVGDAWPAGPSTYLSLGRLSLSLRCTWPCR